ncbi:MAG: hypothetical protein ACI9MR_001439 [Myxococcota bacterium]|jgi:hypothetical protein
MSGLGRSLDHLILELGWREIAKSRSEVSTDSTDDLGQSQPGTCAGSCGGNPANGACWCDTHCRTNGDCCADYVDSGCVETPNGFGGTFLFGP